MRPWWALLYSLILSSVHSDYIPDWQSVLTDTTESISLKEWKFCEERYLCAPATVPGDLLSDLIHNKTIGDPYFDRNFLEQRHVWLGNNNSKSFIQRSVTWIYEAEFLTNDTTTNKILVVEGIKMGAQIYINNHTMGEPVTDQFLRYIFPIDRTILDEGTKLDDGFTRHSLKVRFDPSIDTSGRFMACSGGWDWAPYGRAVDGRGSRIFTLGIVKPIYVLGVDRFYTSYFTVVVDSDDSYDPAAGFVLKLSVTVERVKATGSDECFILFESVLFGTIRDSIIFESGASQKTHVVYIDIPSRDIELWWPNGMGEQPLYRVDAAIESESLQWISRRVGFRSVALITSKDESSRSDGSGEHGMLFRVNGVDTFVRGANVVPMDQLEGRWTDEGHAAMVESAAGAGMNMLRLWGGGAILPRAFYEECDKFGIMLYHDLMFVGEQNHSAFDLSVIRSEVEHIVKGLMHHPSIVLWSGCNECTYFGGNMTIYEDTVLPLVAQTDSSRIIWPSSPSTFGWSHGVRQSDGKPNGRKFRIKVNGIRELEAHGPYQRGVSDTYPCVNGLASSNSYETNIPANLSSTDSIGTRFPNTFYSEFGSSVYSSFESMSHYLRPQDWGVHGGSPPDTCVQIIGDEYDCSGGNAMAERNYSCDSRIVSFFGDVALDAIGELPFQLQLFLCMISQALWMKNTIESLRQTNTYGLLIWQLNDIWPTGGWSLLEYGPANGVAGQILGGRWKPLLYLLSSSSYRDVIVACGEGLHCFVRNDGREATTVELSIRTLSIDSDDTSECYRQSFELLSGPGSIIRFDLSDPCSVEADALLLSYRVQHSSLIVMSENTALLKIPLDMKSRFRDAAVHVNIQRRSEGLLSISLQSNRVLVFTVLSSPKIGKFSDNAFTVIPSEERRISFMSGSEMDVDEFKQSLQLEHLGSPYVSTKLIFDTSLHDSILLTGQTNTDI